MANKDQRKGRETRKPKQEKSKVATTVSPFIVTSGKPAAKPAR